MASNDQSDPQNISNALDGIDWEAVEAYTRANQANQVNPNANSRSGNESFQQSAQNERNFE